MTEPTIPSSGPGSNTGHGLVWARPDGARARCGGPATCRRCAEDRSTYSLPGPEPATDLRGWLVRRLHVADCGCANAVHTPDVWDYLCSLADAVLTAPSVQVAEETGVLPGGSLNGHNPDLAVYAVIRVPLHRLVGCTVDGCGCTPSGTAPIEEGPKA